MKLFSRLHRGPKIQVIEKVQVIQSEQGILVFIDPMYADFAQQVEYALLEVLHVHAAIVLPLPHNSIEMYAVDYPIMMVQQQVPGAEK